MQPRRRRSISLLLTFMLVFAVVGSPVANAQGDAVSDAFCASLTVEEVAAALGTDVVVTPEPAGCSWASADGSSFTYLGARWEAAAFDEVAALFPGGTSLTIADRPAYYASEYGLLYVQLDQGVLLLQLSTPAEVEPQAALEGLAALIVGRAGTLSAPAGPEPAQTFHADGGLEALFPATVGGQALTIASMPASMLISSVSEGTDALVAQLAADGKTVDDMTVATGMLPDMSALIYAIRVAGVDATKYAPLLLATMDASAQPTPGQVAGKDVTVVSSLVGAQHFYAHNDTIWIVVAEEPALTEIFTALP